MGYEKGIGKTLDIALESALHVTQFAGSHLNLESFPHRLGSPKLWDCVLG